MLNLSLRERLLLAILERLHPVAEAVGATLHRSPTVAITREHCPALVLFPEKDVITVRANDRVTRELTIRLVSLARAVPPEMPETAADRLLTLAHDALFTDVNFGGRALGLKELDCEWEVEDADAVAAAIPARYCLTYRTFAADLALQG